MPADPPPPNPKRWLVDGFNVLHTGVLRGRQRGTWWEAEARGQLLERVNGFTDEGDDDAELWIVFDGPRPVERTPTEGDGPHVVFAPSADDWVLAEVRGAADPEQVTVVTADRKLADRARHRGARVVSPRSFLARCASDPEAG